jgi:putative Holliday junction resolvase
VQLPFPFKRLFSEKVEVLIGEPKQMNGQPSESASIIKGFVTHFTNHFPDMKVIRVDERFTSKWQFNPCLITD